MNTPALRAVVLCIGVMCAPSMVAGQTFKGGQVAWQASDALTIEFSIQGTWRRDAEMSQ